MKYKTGKILVDGEWKEIDLENISLKQAMNISGIVCCPGKECYAKLYSVHSAKNGGRTVHFKATNNSHKDECPYRIENYKAHMVNVSENGYFTEKQVNDFVRTLYKDVTMPLNEKRQLIEERKKKRMGKTDKRSTDSGKGKKISYVGKIIQGENIEGAVKGRMSRRYMVDTSDLGKQIGVYGNLQNAYMDQYGQLYMEFEEERYNNIKVLVGAVYENNNQAIYQYLSVVLKYFSKKRSKGYKSFLVAAGMVNQYNGQLIIEVQARNGFVIDGKNISKLNLDNIVA